MPVFLESQWNVHQYSSENKVSLNAWCMESQWGKKYQSHLYSQSIHFPKRLNCQILLFFPLLTEVKCYLSPAICVLRISPILSFFPWASKVFYLSLPGFLFSFSHGLWSISPSAMCPTPLALNDLHRSSQHHPIMELLTITSLFKFSPPWKNRISFPKFPLYFCVETI